MTNFHFDILLCNARESVYGELKKKLWVLFFLSINKLLCAIRWFCWLYKTKKRSDGIIICDHSSEINIRNKYFLSVIIQFSSFLCALWSKFQTWSSYWKLFFSRILIIKLNALKIFPSYANTFSLTAKTHTFFYDSHNLVTFSRNGD